MKKLQIFHENHGLTPIQKCQFCGCLKPMFSLFRKACLLNKTFKIVFVRFIITIYDMRIPGVTRGYRGVTRGYKGLQGVKVGYKGLQWVSRGDRGLLGLLWVTTGDRGLQGVAMGIRGLQGVTAGYKGL